MPPTIEKLQETWTSGSITTLFRLCSAADITSSLRLQSPVAGFNWSLTLQPQVSPQPFCSHGYPGCRGSSKHPKKKVKSDKSLSDENGHCMITWAPLMCQLFFDSSDCYGLWRGELVKVTLSIPSHSDRDIDSSLPASTTLVLGCNLHPLVTDCPASLGDALISLEVAFIFSPTHNLFHVLAHAGLVQRVPSIAEEPNVLQARTALRALEQSLKTGTSFDIIFQAYTRRISPGKVTRPIPIYANTTVLQATTLLPDFAKENLNFSSLFELPEGDTLPLTSPESYEYESDSDLDDDEGDNLATMKPTEELTSGGEASACHEQQSHTPVHDARPHEDTTDSGSLSSFSNFEAGFQERNRMSALEEAETVLNENMKSSSRVVLVKGVAWKTWHAFVYYCYTGIVNFSSLRSQATTEATLQQSPFTDGPPHCSPKSMYQLAMKLHNDSLAQLALKAIETRLSSANILDEALSKFTARHDAVREMEIAFLITHKSQPDVLRGLSAKIEAMVMGNMPHAGPVLTMLYQRIAQMPTSSPRADESAKIVENSPIMIK